MTKKSFTLFVLCMSIITVPGAFTTFAQTLNPVYTAAFNDLSLNASGWKAMAPGSPGDFNLAQATIGSIPAVANFSNDRGLRIVASAGQGATLLGPVIETGNNPVLIRVSVFAQNAGGSIAMGALDSAAGTTAWNLDGSVCYSIETNSNAYMDTYHKIIVMYYPKRKAIVPVLQLAVARTVTTGAVTVIFDNLEVYSLNQDTVKDASLQKLLGIVPGVQPTPTNTPTQIAKPTPTPASTPNPQTPITVDNFYKLPLDDKEDELFNPSTVFDINDNFTSASNLLSQGFVDVVLKEINNQTFNSSQSFTVNEAFENTETKAPDLSIDNFGARHVVWADNRSLEKLYSIYLCQMDTADKRLFDSDTEVNNLYVKTNAQQPAIAAQSSGKLAVCWIDDRNYTNDVFVRRFDWNGKTLTMADAHDFQINTPFENTDVANPDISFDENGNITAVWSDNRLVQDNQQRYDIYARFFIYAVKATDKNILPSNYIEMQLSTYNTTLDHAKYPKIATAAERCVVVWQNEDPKTGAKEIHAAVTTPSGKMLQPEFIVDGGSSTRDVYPDVKYVGKYMFMISWYDEATKEVFVKVYDVSQNTLLTQGVSVAQDVNPLGRLSLALDAQYHFLTLWDNFEPTAKGTLMGVSGNIYIPGYTAMTTPKTVSSGDVSAMAIKTLHTSPERNTIQTKEELKDHQLSPKR